MRRTSTLLASVLVTSLAVTACGGSPDSTNGLAGNDASKPSAPMADDVGTVSGARLADYTGDPSRGEAMFVQCKACHAIDPGLNRAGPSLHAMVGRKAGTVPGYSYSNVNRNSGITWTAEKLFQFLEKPTRVMPGTKMAFAGIQDPQQRADLISWLSSQK